MPQLTPTCSVGGGWQSAPTSLLDPSGRLVHLPLGLLDERVDVLVAAGLLPQQDLPLLPPLPNLRHAIYTGDHHCVKRNAKVQ